MTDILIPADMMADRLRPLIKAGGTIDGTEMIPLHIATVTAIIILLDQAAALSVRPEPVEGPIAADRMREHDLAVLIVELVSMIKFGKPDLERDQLIRRARRVIDGRTRAIEQGEANYRAYCAADPEHAAEGTREALATVAHMFEEYGPECFPANVHGQIDFARSMMDAGAREIRAFLAAVPA